MDARPFNKLKIAQQSLPSRPSLEALMCEMWHQCLPYGERAERLAGPWLNMNGQLRRFPGLPSLLRRQLYAAGRWFTIFGGVVGHDQPYTIYHAAGDPYRDQVVQDRADGRLGLQPLGSMTKPAQR